MLAETISGQVVAACGVEDDDRSRLVAGLGTDRWATPIGAATPARGAPVSPGGDAPPGLVAGGARHEPAASLAGGSSGRLAAAAAAGPAVRGARPDIYPGGRWRRVPRPSR